MSAAQEGRMNAGAAYQDEILVVDDTTGSLKLLEEILAAAGYLVRLSSDGELALRSANIQPPALVLLDIRMPGMDGYEVCRRLKEDDKTRSIPVIFLSILEDDREKVKAFEAGGVDYINKPFRPAEVLARVKTHLALRHALLDLEARNAELEEASATLEDKVSERSAELEQSNRKLREQIEVHLQMLEVLRENKARLSEAQRIAKIGNWEWDVPTNKLWWSDETFRIFGMKPGEFGADFESFINAVHPDDRERVQTSIKDTLQSDSGGWQIDYRIAAADGAIHFVHEEAETVFDCNGRPLKRFGTVQDITARQRANEEICSLNEGLELRVKERTAELDESQRALMNIVGDLNLQTAELEDANSKLQELDRMKSMFIASMSHELRTPLNSIIGFSRIVLAEWIGPLNGEQKENLSTVLRSGSHLLSLVNDVIDVSKIEAGMIEVIADDFDVFDVVAEVAESFENDVGVKGVTLTVPALHYPLHTDRTRLLQCLLNLVSNAVKYTEKGTITVSAKLAEGSCMMELSVADTGIGIAEDDLGKLFIPFVRLDSPLRTTVPGTGLGLYLTRKLVREVLRGDITVTSIPCVGSTFVLTVPVSLQQ
ncbi:MAG: response regulator [Desulfuromonadaceae bacterium]|nr:response regulator [Desulfuromonadaceae bacterium]MDD5106441.1 response regulator [Desulfuromonadaceae bacterium]